MAVIAKLMNALVNSIEKARRLLNGEEPTAEKKLATLSRGKKLRPKRGNGRAGKASGAVQGQARARNARARKARPSADATLHS